MKKAVIFDLDGTLWDSSRQIIPVWNAVLKENSVDREIVHQDICNCMGKTSEQIAEMLFPNLSREKGLALVLECCRREADSLQKTGAVLYPELMETLLDLKKDYHLYIVSNCEDGYIQAFLTAHKFWDIIEDFECIGRTGRCKGDNIRLVIERNDIDRAIYVGDTASDQAAAQLAGIPFVHAAYGFGKVESEQKLNCIADIVEKAAELLL